MDYSFGCRFMRLYFGHFLHFLSFEFLLAVNFSELSLEMRELVFTVLLLALFVELRNFQIF